MHLARTPPLAKNIVEETLIDSTTTAEQETADTYIKTVKDIHTGWVADHAKYVCDLIPFIFINYFIVIDANKNERNNDRKFN